MSNQPEETSEVRRNRILGDAIGLTPWEVAQTPELVRAKIIGLQGGLFTHTRPIDFEGLQISSI